MSITTTVVRSADWIKELAIGYALLVVINLRFFSDNAAFNKAAPHPYLLLIMMLACRYGLFPGMVTAGVGGAIYWIWVHPVAQFQIFNMPGSHALNVLLMLGAGGLFGWLRSTYIKYEEDQRQRAREQDQTITALNDKLGLLQEVNQQLEGQILNRVDTFAILYNISTKLAQLDVPGICQQVPELVAEHLQAERTSVYLYEHNTLVVRGSFGWEESMGYPKQVNLERSMMGIACREKRTVCIREYLDNPTEMQFLGDSVLCAPLLDKQGNLMGVVNVESMPFLKVNRSAVTTFEVLSKWVAEALEKAYYVAEVQTHAITDTLLDLYTRDYLAQRLAEEFRRSKTYYLPLSLALIKLEPLPGQQPQARLDELRTVATYMRHVRREVDIVTRFSDAVPVAVLMTTTSSEECEERAKRFQTELGQLLPAGTGAPRIKIGLSSFDVNMAEWKELQAQAEKGLE